MSSLSKRIDALEAKLLPRTLAQRALAEHAAMPPGDGYAILLGDPDACARWPAAAEMLHRMFAEILRQPSDDR